MFESKYNKLLTIVLVIVIIAIIGLLVFWGIDVESNTTGSSKRTKKTYKGYVVNGTMEIQKLVLNTQY